jgi:hypothetical protein
MKLHALAIAMLLLLFSACSSTEEQVKTEPPPVEKEKDIKPIEPVREYTYSERYYVRNATIGDPTDVDDALQAIRVIQLKPGGNEVLVINSMEKYGDNTMETWFGIELPSFAPGQYDLSQAAKIAFYRFYLGEDRKRIDGAQSEGSIKIESSENGELIGSINATTSGMTKSFQAASAPVKVTFTGSFRIQETELENTIMKSR